MPSTSPVVSLPKKNTQVTSNLLKKSPADKRQRKYKQKSSYVDGSGASSQTESDDTEKSSSSSSSSQKKQQRQQRRCQYKKRTSTQQKSPSIPVEMKSSAVGYAGPDFMIDAPSPSSLPLPNSLRSKTTKQQQQHFDTSKPYLMDPISELQEKLRMILKIQV